jgi:hypothetical protein
VPQYRGYKIELMHDGSGWQVTVHPMRPDLPILRQFSFRPEPFPEGAAPESGRRRADSLALVLFSPVRAVQVWAGLGHRCANDRHSTAQSPCGLA